jgi:uncharacterized protein YndB with AHSA1/START domain
MSNHPSLVEYPSDREIVSSRVFAVPRGFVFDAFSDSARLAQWWGPKDFTNTFHEFDLRPGGHWRLTMHGPNSAHYENESVFVEVVKPERIVFQHLEPVHGFLMTMTFADEAGATRLTWRMCFESASECTRVKLFVSEANEQNFVRLAAHLAATSMNQGGNGKVDPLATFLPESAGLTAGTGGGKTPDTTPPKGVDPNGATIGEPAPVETLTPEEQMARFEKELKENDWGHQPC